MRTPLFPLLVKPDRPVKELGESELDNNLTKVLRAVFPKSDSLPESRVTFILVTTLCDYGTVKKLSPTLERYLGIDPDNPTEYQRRSEDWQRTLKCRAGMSPAQFEELLNLQNGVCAICKEPPGKGGDGKKFFLDHDHKGNLIRGLLCNRCNLILGRFQDSVTNLEAATMYLRQHPAEQLRPRPKMLREQRGGRLCLTSESEVPKTDYSFYGGDAAGVAQNEGQTTDLTGYISPRKAGSVLGIHNRTLRRWILSGKCRAIRGPTGRYWVEKAWLEEKLRGGVFS